MTRKKALLIGLTVAAGGAGAYFAIKAVRPARPLNILIVSACSLRWDVILPDGTGGNNKTKFISKLASRSFVFQNAFSDVSWSNVSGFLSQIKPEAYAMRGYKAIGRHWNQHDSTIQRVPPGTPPYYFQSPEPNRIPMPLRGYREDIQALQPKMLDRNNWPFLLVLHTKFMHMPYRNPLFRDLGEVEAAEYADIQYARARINEFLSAPEKNPEGIFLTILLGHGRELSPPLLRRLPIRFDLHALSALSSKKNSYFVGLLNDPELLRLWRRSPRFAKDLETIRAFYNARLGLLDRQIRFLINGLGDKELVDNMVVIFMGDHGEGFGEHGYVGHGEAIYDEMHRFPLFVHFPGMENQQLITPQIHQAAVADIVEGVMSGSLHSGNFGEFLAKRAEDEYILFRNCPGDTVGVRYRNEWKFVMELASGKKQLFHLTEDPGETRNVLDSHPDVAAKLEEHWLTAAPTRKGNAMHQECKVMP